MKQAKDIAGRPVVAPLALLFAAFFASSGVLADGPEESVVARAPSVDASNRPSGSLQRADWLATEVDPALLERAQALGDGIDARSRDSSVGVGYGVAEGTVAAPMDRVMDTITAYGDYVAFMPNFRSSRVLSQRGHDALVYLEASALRDTVTLWAQMRMYARPARGATQIIEGRMRQGNLAHFVARWEVTPLDEGRTWVAFHVLFVPDLPFPDALVTDENVRAARRTVRNLRRHLSGG